MPATLCACTWQVITIDPDLDPVWLRVTDAPDCGLHGG